MWSWEEANQGAVGEISGNDVKLSLTAKVGTVTAKVGSPSSPVGGRGWRRLVG